LKIATSINSFGGGAGGVV